MPVGERHNDLAPTEVSIPGPSGPVGARTCEYCGQLAPAGERHQALVSDRGSARPHIVTACGPDHLQRLIDQPPGDRPDEAGQ